MAQHQFILRLLDKDRHVLGWTKLFAETRGDGCFRAMQHFVAEADATGTGTDVCIHWPDVNVHRTVPLAQPIAAVAGAVFSVPLNGEAILTIDGDARPLPPVTVRTAVHVQPASYGR